MVTLTDDEALNFTSIGIDIGKDVFHLVGFDPSGQIALRRKIRRLDLAKEYDKLPPCVVGMEACLCTHFVSRTLRGPGFEPRIIPAKYTRPFIKGQKNGYNDAEATLRPNLKVMRKKTRDQLCFIHPLPEIVGGGHF
jgi:transposase